LFTIVLWGRTHYVSLENLSARGLPPRCLLGTAFSVKEAMHDLSHLETLLADDEVNAVLECRIVATAAGDDGVCITIDRAEPITKPVPKPPREAKEDVEDDADADEDLVVVGSDCESDGGGFVCSGDEASDEDSYGSGDASSDEEDVADLKARVTKTFLKMQPANAMPGSVIEQPATGGAQHSGKAALWQDEYFWIADTTSEFIHAKVRSQWKAGPDGLGSAAGTKAPMSKQVTPRDFGESRDAPARSILVLRAWAVWRARQCGWADGHIRRKHHFDEQERLLEKSIRVMDEPCGLLGNPRANHALEEMAPDMTARLTARLEDRRRRSCHQHPAAI
jgi:hypothetical protein